MIDIQFHQEHAKKASKENSFSVEVFSFYDQLISLRIFFLSNICAITAGISKKIMQQEQQQLWNWPKITEINIFRTINS